MKWDQILIASDIDGTLLPEAVKFRNAIFLLCTALRRRADASHWRRAVPLDLPGSFWTVCP